MCLYSENAQTYFMSFCNNAHLTIIYKNKESHAIQNKHSIYTYENVAKVLKGIVPISNNQLKNVWRQSKYFPTNIHARYKLK